MKTLYFLPKSIVFPRSHCVSSLVQNYQTRKRVLIRAKFSTVIYRASTYWFPVLFMCVLRNNKSMVMKKIKSKINETTWWHKKQLVYCSFPNSQAKTKICLKTTLIIVCLMKNCFKFQPCTDNFYSFKKEFVKQI